MFEVKERKIQKFEFDSCLKKNDVSNLLRSLNEKKKKKTGEKGLRFYFIF